MDDGVRHAWLDYAWSVVDADHVHPEHFAACRGALRRSTASVDPDLRWPGVVGRRYEPGRGVLFVGSVHREFHVGARGLTDAELVRHERALVEANRTWRRDGRSEHADASYLRATQDAYEGSFARWPRAQVLTSVMKLVGDGPDQLAWTNIAKCQATIGSANETRLQRSCGSVGAPYPIRDLVDLLDPAVVLIPVIAVSRTSPGGDFGLLDRPNVYVFDGRKQVDASGRRVAEWRREAVERLTAARA